MSRTLLQRQLARVRRRLLVAALLTRVGWCVLVALAVAGVWVLAQPYLVSEAGGAWRWAVVGGLAGGAVVVGAALAIWRRPTAVAAALALDERYGLKERATTALSLSVADAASPAGQALLADAEARLATVRVSDKFPIRVPRSIAATVPPALLAVALLALWWNPPVGESPDSVDPDAATPEARADLDQQVQQLAAKRTAKKPDDPRSPELERIEAEVERFVRRPRDSNDDLRERIKDATALEDQIRREQREQVDRADALREQLKQTERLTRKKRDPKSAGAAADALARGDLDRAADELQRLSRRMEQEEARERLRRKMRDPALTDDERKQAEADLHQLDREQNLTQKDRDELAKQLEAMEEQLKRLTRGKAEQEKDLKEQAYRGEIDRDQLDRELDQLHKNADRLAQDQDELKELADQLGECKRCAGEGEDGEAARRLAKAADKAGRLGKSRDNAELARTLVQVQQVRRALVRGAGNQPGQGAGRRPEQKDDAATARNTAVPGAWDEKGKLQGVGQGPPGGFKGPRKPSEMQEEIRQAAQEAPAALDRQRLPPSARNMARGYFARVRGTDEKKK